MLLIGVDEAGYGPLLGPLVVAGTAIRAPGAADGAEAGARLLRAVGLLRRGGLVVGDSKAVAPGPDRLARLERPVLAFLACRRRAPTFPGFLDAVGADRPEGAEAWYGLRPATYPLDPPDALDAAARTVREALEACDLEFAGFRADVVAEGRLNRAFSASGNKADTLFDVGACVLEGLLSLAGKDEPVHVVFDRLGGRRHYLPSLLRRWPTAFPWALEETRRASRYRLALEGRPCELSYLVGGDRDAPQVGLASLLAKYLRERHMEMWNAWFARICPGVAPTAGYVEDGRRWLEESRVAREAAGIPDALLVRTR